MSAPKRTTRLARWPRLCAQRMHALAMAPLCLLAQANGQESWLDWLFDLQDVSWSDPQTAIGWRYALPAWAWALIILGAVVFAAWSYSRLLGPRVARTLLAAVRGLLLVLIAALIAGPTLVRHDERVEPDWLTMLIDRSASMQVRDLADPQTGEALSRDAQLRRALQRQANVFDAHDGLGAQRHLNWLGFDREVRPIGSAADSAAWPEPDAQATQLRTAIDQALRRAAGQPMSGIVLFTDGRSPQTTGADLIKRLQQQAVPVFVVPLGAQQMPLDLAVGPVDHPERAFVEDVVPVAVTVRQLSGETNVDPARVRVRLIDTATGDVLDERSLADAGVGLNEPVRLRGQGDSVGEAGWRVEVTYDGQTLDATDADADADADTDAGNTTTTDRELITRNNQRDFTVQLIDRPLRVLYVDAYPRWEYRYLKTLLIREKSIESSILLLSADRDFAQEGDVPITRLPADAQELEPYDVVIIGDVPANYFSAAQMSLLRDHVAARGAGLLWIGGSRHTPMSYQGTPLADLLPMRQPGSVTRLSANGGQAELRPTPLARNLSVLALRSPEDAGAGANQTNNNDSAMNDWPTALPPLRWAQSIGALKPAAEPLAVTQQPGPDGEPQSLVARQRYGAGQSLYVATDDIWRWRYGRGEWYYQQFWLQLVRMLGRARVQQGGELAWLTVAPQRVNRDAPVVVELTVSDPRLQRQLSQVSIEVERAAQAQDGTGSADSPDDDSAVGRFELRPVAGESETDGPLPRRVYRATWRPKVAGPLTLRVAEPALGGLDLARDVEVIAPDDELRRPQPDHARLARLAEQTGGAVVALDQLDQLRPLVPNRDRRIPNDVSEPLWNSTVVLIVFLGLLALEWVLRKVIRLV